MFGFTPEKDSEYSFRLISSGESEIIITDKDSNTVAAGKCSVFNGEYSSVLTVPCKADEKYSIKITLNDSDSAVFEILETAECNGINLSENSRAMFVSDSFVLRVFNEPWNSVANITFESSDENVAAVDGSGKVTAVGEGIADIICRADGKFAAACTVTVTKPVEITPDETVTATFSQTNERIVYSFTPSEDGFYTLLTDDDKHYDVNGNPLEIGYSKSARLYDENGFEYTRTDYAEFNLYADMTAGMTYYFEIGSAAPAENNNTVHYNVTLKKMAAADGIKSSVSNITLFVGSTYYLDYALTPAYAVPEGFDVSNSDDNVIYVSDRYVEARSSGTSTITVVSDTTGQKLTYTVTVLDPIKLEVNSPVTANSTAGNPNGNILFNFTPKKSGAYELKFECPYSVGFYTSAEDMDYTTDFIYSDENTTVYKLYVNAGVTYTIYSYAQNPQGDFSMTATVTETVYAESLEVVKMPAVSEIIGDPSNNTPDLTGLVIRINWSDGTFTDWEYDISDMQLRGTYIMINTTDAGKDGTVTVSYGNRNTSFKLKLLPNPVSRIEIIKVPQTEFVWGDVNYGYVQENTYVFDPTNNYFDFFYDIGLKVYYTDSTSKTFYGKDIVCDMLDGNFVSFMMENNNIERSDDINDVTNVNMNVTYLGATASYTLKVKPTTVSSIEFTPKTGETLRQFIPDFVGSEVKINYIDGTSKTITLTDENIVYDPSLPELPDHFIIDGQTVEILAKGDNNKTNIALGYFSAISDTVDIILTDKGNITDFSTENFTCPEEDFDLIMTFEDGTTQKIRVDIQTDAKITSSGAGDYMYLGKTSLGNVWFFFDVPSQNTYKIRFCGIEKTVATGACSHDYNWVVTTPATTEHEGIETGTCTKCGDKTARTIAKLPIREITVKENGNIKKSANGLKIAGNVKITDIINATGGATQLFNADGTPAKTTDTVKTGMKVRLIQNGKTADETEIIVLGDVNCDGDISVSDARLALRNAVKLEQFKGAQLQAAIVSGKNSEVSVSDARLILRAAVNLESPEAWLGKVG